MDTKLFIFGATLLLSFFISHNRALPLKPYEPTIIDHFVHNVRKFYLANLDREKLEDKISDNNIKYLYLWEHISHSWFYSIYLLVNVQDGVDSTTRTLPANHDQSTDDRSKALELIREFAGALELANQTQSNATGFYEKANKLSPALILADLLEWKASKDAMLKTIYDFIMSDAVKSADSQRNIFNFMNRQYVTIMCLKLKSANLPIPVNTAAFKEKANNNPTQAIKFIRAYENIETPKMMQSIYSIVVNGFDGMNSTNYMKNFVSSSKNDVHWLTHKYPFSRTILDIAKELMELKSTMDMNITLFKEKAAIDPALTTEFLNLYYLSTRYNILQEEFSIIVNGAEGMNGADYMAHFLRNVNDAARARKQ